MSAPLLETRGLTKTFGGLKAVQQIDLSVGAQRIVSVIGPNGAGKTTFFNCLSGIYRPDGGTITLDGRDVTGRPPHQLCRLGLARTFQNIRLFPEMSVLENVLVAQFQHRALAPLPLLLRAPLAHLSDYQLLLFGAIMVIMMLHRPQGLIGSARRKEEILNQ